MNPERVGLYAIHLLFAGLWSGSVLFVTAAVLPAARDGKINAEPLSWVTGRLQTISRLSAVLLLLTGLRMAMLEGYTSSESLFGTTNGLLVVAMIVLWLVLMGLVEVGASRLTDGTSQKKVRSPARDARPFFLAASLAAVLLLVNAGAITGGF